MNLRRYLGIAVAASVSAYAQNVAPTGKPQQSLQIEAPRAPKTTEVSTNAISRNAVKLPKETTVTYGGLIPEARKSTNFWRMFSLRRPVNLKDDSANLLRDTRTEGGGAVKLFSIDF